MNRKTLSTPVFTSLEGHTQSYSRFEQSEEPLVYMVTDFNDYADWGAQDATAVPANAKAVGVIEKLSPIHPDYELIRYKTHATSPQMAAELFAEMWFDEWFRPDSFDLVVVDPDGKEWRCKVNVETKFIFTAACEEFSDDSDTDEVEDQ